MDTKEFFKKNCNVYHIVGMVLGAVLAAIYWARAGHLSDNVLKNSPVLMPILGVLVGYITFDLIFNAKNRKNRQRDE